MTLSGKLKALTRQLYPKGRAFNFPDGGFLDGLHIALNTVHGTTYNDAASILFDILPDTANFTTDDATDWERRLGLANGSSLPLATRNTLIENKLNQPGIDPGRSSWTYLQTQLNNVTWVDQNNNPVNLYVYENRFLQYPSLNYITETPEQASGRSNFLTNTQFNDCQFNDRNFGAGYNNKVVNSITAAEDTFFNFGGDFKNTFFIGGSPNGTNVNVSKNMQTQLRQLILQTKPVQTICFLFVTFL